MDTKREPFLIDLETSVEGMVELNEFSRQVPFAIRRVFYIIQSDLHNMSHSQYSCHMLIIAIRGSFIVNVEKASYLLDRPNQGLYIPPGVYTEVCNFSPIATCLTLCSEPYDVKDNLFSVATMISLDPPAAIITNEYEWHADYSYE